MKCRCGDRLRSRTFSAILFPPHPLMSFIWRITKMTTYTTPELEVIAFEADDIIATSEPTMDAVTELPYDEF